MTRKSSRPSKVAQEKAISANSAAQLEHSSHEMASEHRPGLLPEENFRWRAGEITRLEAFSDVVFGFALTLLVISLEVPRSYAALMTDLQGLLPFAACFTLLVGVWRMHYIYSRRYGLEDPYTIFLNMVLLFLVLFCVYPLKFVFTLLYSHLMGGDAGDDVSWHGALVLVQLFFLGFASLLLLFTLMYAHAYKLRAKLGLNAIEARKTRDAIEINGVGAAMGLLSLALAFKNPFWSAGASCLYGPLSFIHGSIAKKRIRRLLAEKA
jgi:uncharacterized membrane protein